MEAKSIYAISFGVSFENVHLMKDCCLIPYVFHKMYGYTPVIVTPKKGEYPYLEQLPGLVMEFLPTPRDTAEWIETAGNYIREHYAQMDILFGIGAYGAYAELFFLYKQLRPDGKIILKLDINSFWADNMYPDGEEHRKIFENADIVTCESKRMKKFLSEKWDRRIDYVTNGIMEPEAEPKLCYEDKQNVILTVGRIGTEQKRNELLLSAFAAVSEQIPDWSVRLAGPVDSRFDAFVDRYFATYPHLKDRVIFTGAILDKDELFAEYAKAKVFALTSIVEGGTPNVFSEAAQHGCYTICSDIDASAEFTNWERCGRVLRRGDAGELAEILLETCRPENEPAFRQTFDEMRKYRRRYFSYDMMVRRLHYLLEAED